MVEVENFEFGEPVESHLSGETGDAVVGEVELEQVGALVYELQLLAHDVIARQHQDLQFLRDHQLVVEKYVLTRVRLLSLDV
jgi:hypothetical protein